MIASLMPWTLMSICSAVTPSVVPVTLKSMSPNASSLPRMSVSTANLPSLPVTRPIAAPATGALIGTPASISASVEPHVEAIEVDPFEVTHSDTTRMTYGKLFLARQDGHERSLGERAVADLAPARAAHRLVLARRIGRQVVVVQVALRLLGADGVDALDVGRRSERGDRQRLRLAAGEEPRAMRPRQEADLDRDRPDRLQVAAVHADALVEHQLADDLLVQQAGEVLARSAPPCAPRRSVRRPPRFEAPLRCERIALATVSLDRR